MEKLEYNRKENKIEKGKDITIHAIFMRHGEKIHNPNNPETELTPEGEKKSFEFGEGRKNKDTIKPYASDTIRTQRTAEFATAGSPIKNKGKIRKREELSFIYDEKGQFLEDILKIKMDILGKDYEDLPDDEKRKRLCQATSKQIDYYLNFREKRPDPKTYSPIETASGIARLIDKYITMTSKLKIGSSVDLINTTHDFNLAAFLKETIVREIEGKKVKGFQSIEDIGGPIGFNENFEIIINRKNENDVSVKMLFRGQEYEIDMDRVKELTEISKKLEKEKYDK